jgi:hypothetical protein
MKHTPQDGGPATPRVIIGTDAPPGGTLAELGRAIEAARKLMGVAMIPPLATIAEAHAYRATNPPQTGAAYVALMTRIDQLARLEGVTR